MWKIERFRAEVAGVWLFVCPESLVREQHINGGKKKKGRNLPSYRKERSNEKNCSPPEAKEQENTTKKKSYLLFSFKGERNIKRAADWKDSHNHPQQTYKSTWKRGILKILLHHLFFLFLLTKQVNRNYLQPLSLFCYEFCKCFNTEEINK